MKSVLRIESLLGEVIVEVHLIANDKRVQWTFTTMVSG
jgi:hypothetical protein